MSLRRSDEIGPRKQLIPFSETMRVNEISKYRELYEGNFTRLGIPLNGTNTPTSLFGNATYSSFEDIEINVRINWFRRIANFFPEFMLAENPIITIEGNPRLTKFLENSCQSLFQSLFYANIDMLRFGEGCIGSDPTDPSRLTVFQPDGHYVVINDYEEVVEDIMLYVVGEKGGRDIQPATQQKVVIIRYPVDGPSTRGLYHYAGGAIGDLIEEQVLPAREGRQIHSLFHGYVSNHTGVSMFKDIECSVAELSTTLTNLSKVIRRNARPHLYGPDGAITLDSSGRAEIDTQGMYIPLHEGDAAPGYLQWDSNIEAISKDIEWHEKNVFDMTGISRLLFDSEANTGVMSGVAMKRLMLPFVAKLNQIKEINKQAIIGLVDMINNNRRINGEEFFEFDPSDLSIEWPFENIFSDDMAVDDEPKNGEQDPSEKDE